MITILYSKQDKIWTEEVFKQHFFLLPKMEQQKIELYKDKKEQQLRICGKLMLKQILYDFKLAPEYDLSDIKHTIFNKPFFYETFFFSIAHSENFVICAASVENNIGIDVEKIKPIDVLLLKDSFTTEEWQMMEQKKFAVDYFYYLWTRKEAVLKAIGKGVYEEMGNIAVLKEEIIYEKQPYYFSDIPIDTSYKITLASDKQDAFEVKEFVFKDY